MGETIEFECDCGEEDRIDSTSLNFIQSATGWDREDSLLCDGCLSEELEGATLDLSIGSDHTRSQQFENERERRRQERKQGEIEHAKRRSPVTLVDVFHDDEYDEMKVEIEMPSEAKPDLKDLEWQLSHPKYDRSVQAWTIDLRAVDRCEEHMEAQGWDVEVAPAVRQRQDS